MPIISPTDGRTLAGRLAILAIYILLSLGGAAMVLPFLVMATGSTANAFDYERRSPLPRHLWSREDRFMRMLATYFPAPPGLPAADARLLPGCPLGAAGGLADLGADRRRPRR